MKQFVTILLLALGLAACSTELTPAQKDAQVFAKHCFDNPTAKDCVEWNEMHHGG